MGIEPLPEEPLEGTVEAARGGESVLGAASPPLDPMGAVLGLLGPVRLVRSYIASRLRKYRARNVVPLNPLALVRPQAHSPTPTGLARIGPSTSRVACACFAPRALAPMRVHLHCSFRAEAQGRRRAWPGQLQPLAEDSPSLRPRL